jgi:hypothetical protein
LAASINIAARPARATRHTLRPGLKMWPGPELGGDPGGSPESLLSRASSAEGLILLVSMGPSCVGPLQLTRPRAKSARFTLLYLGMRQRKGNCAVDP